MERMEQTNQETMAAIQILLQKFASIEARFHDKGPPGFASFGKLPEQVSQETVTHAAKNSHRPELPIFIGEGPDGWLRLAERYFKLNPMPEKRNLEASNDGDGWRGFGMVHMVRGPISFPRLDRFSPPTTEKVWCPELQQFIEAIDES